MTVYVQSTDPSLSETVYFGDEWRDSSSGECYIRNTANNAWVLRMLASTPTGGVLPLSGGTMDDSITIPSSSHLTITDGLITGSGKINGSVISTTTDVSSTQSSLLSSVTDKIQNSVVAVSVIQTQNLVVTVGELDFTNGGQSISPDLDDQTALEIFLPYFPDGVQATEEQCTWLTFANTPSTLLTSLDDSGYSSPEYYTGSDGDYEVADPTQVRTFKCNYYTKEWIDGSPIVTYYGPLVKYVIIGRR